MNDRFNARIPRARAAILEPQEDGEAESSAGLQAESSPEPEGRHAMRAPTPRRRARRTHEQRRLG